MANIWIVSESATIAKEFVTLAKSFGDSTVSMVTFSDSVAQEVAKTGISKVVVLHNQSSWLGDMVNPVSEVLVSEKADVVLVSATILGKSVAPQLAVALDAALVTDATRVEIKNGELETDRMVYGGLAISTQVSSFPAVVTVPSRQYDMAVEAGETAIETKEVSSTSNVSVKAVNPIAHEGVDLNQADKVIGIGRGVGEKADLAMIDELAKVVGAEVGCTRPIAENTDWMPVERYIGISGKQIKGSLYFSVGVSGQIQHVSGIRDTKIIVSINTDENAPMFAATDYGIVGDYKEVIPALVKAIQAVKG